MIIYNVTTKVSPPIHDAWYEWMKLIHIPEIMQTGLFEKNHFCRILDLDDEEGSTYSVQFFAETKEHIDQYMTNFAPGLRQEAFEKWGDQFLSFRTLMEVIN